MKLVHRFGTGPAIGEHPAAIKVFQQDWRLCAPAQFERAREGVTRGRNAIESRMWRVSSDA